MTDREPGSDGALGRQALLAWLARACAAYQLEPIAVFRAGGRHEWPLIAEDEHDLRAKLEAGGHFLPLPQEPASLANVIEVSLVDFLIHTLRDKPGAEVQRGTERGYPDLEIAGPAFGGRPHALDIKVARRAPSGRRTESAISLYTGNTYFRYPSLHWRGTFRPFDDYASHLIIIAVYTLNKDSLSRIENLELIPTESWRVASRKRSSTTREYIGAVQRIDALRAGRGEFESREAFLAYWRKYPFKIGRAVQQQLDKLLRERDDRQLREKR